MVCLEIRYLLNFKTIYYYYAFGRIVVHFAKIQKTSNIYYVNIIYGIFIVKHVKLLSFFLTMSFRFVDKVARFSVYNSFNLLYII